MLIKKRCDNCRKPILEKDHQVILITKNKGKKLEEVYFHLPCWASYFNNAVENKAKKQVSGMQEKVKGLINSPLIKNILTQVKGSEQLISMLNLPLDIQIEQVKKEAISKPKKDGSKNKKKRK